MAAADFLPSDVSSSSDSEEDDFSGKESRLEFGLEGKGLDLAKDDVADEATGSKEGVGGDDHSAAAGHGPFSRWSAKRPAETGGEAEQASAPKRARWDGGERCQRTTIDNAGDWSPALHVCRN